MSSKGSSVAFAIGVLIILAQFLNYLDIYLYAEELVPIPSFSTVCVAIIGAGYCAVSWPAAGRVLINAPELKTLLFFGIGMQISIIGLLINGGTSEMLYQFLKTDVHLGFYLILAAVGANTFFASNLLKILTVYVAIGLVLALLAVLQFLHLNVVQLPGIEPVLFGCAPVGTNTDTWRTAAVFSEPSWFAPYVIDWIAITLAWFIARRHLRIMLLLLPLSAAFVCCSALTGYLSLLLLIALTTFSFPAFRLQIRAILLIFASLATAAITVAAANPYFQTALATRIRDVTTGSDASGNSRLDTSLAGLQVGREHVAFGVGIGNGAFYIPSYYRHWASYPHESGATMGRVTCDSYLSLLFAEHGLIGWLLLAGLVYKLIEKPSQRLVLWRTLSAERRCDWLGGMREIGIFRIAFRNIVCINMIQLAFSGNFLHPRLWINVSILIALKWMETVRQFRPQDAKCQ